jgi:hypothetical protein
MKGLEINEESKSKSINSRSIKIPEVDVLIAIKDGSKYIRDQLQSIASQRGVEINLIAGIDGTDEKSESILRELNSCFKTTRIFHFPEVGVDENFSRLLAVSGSEFIATCDQDDVWLDQHLLKSIDLLSLKSPSLSFSQLSEFNQTSKKVRIWPILKRNKIPHFAIFENVARGCTQVFNSKARDIIISTPKPEGVPRDWWIYALIHARHGVRFLPEVTVHYRLHDSNLIGADRSIASRIKRFSKMGLNHTYGIASAFQKELDYLPKTSLSPELSTLVRFLNGSFSSRFKVAFNLKHRYRSDLLTEVALRLLLLKTANNVRKI